MTRMTAQQISDLNTSMSAAQNVNLGTLLDQIQYGNVTTPLVGTLTPMTPVKYNLVPANASATGVHAAITCPTSGTTTVTTGMGTIDYPRIISLVGNQASVTGDCTIVGTDFYGVSQTETMTTNGTSTVYSTKSYKSITSITVPTRGAASDTIAFGFANRFGMPVAIPDANLIIATTFNSAADAGSTTVGSTYNTTYYTISGTPDGAKTLSIVFLT